MCTNKDVIIINIDEPRYDQETFWGRVQYSFHYRNPFKIFTSSSKLEEARCVYLKYRCGQVLPSDVDEEDIWKAKSLYDTAFHPVTGEKIPFLARPPAQIPIDAILAGGLMAFYRFTPAVVVWHWLNQSYNAFISYAHNSKDTLTNKQLMTSYILSTGTAIGTALGLNHLLRCSPSIVGRFVPLAAVAAAHCVHVPLIKAQMLKNGAAVYDECDTKIAFSKRAAQAAINGVALHKILIAVPPLLFTPLITSYMERRGTFCRYPWSNFPMHAGLAGLFLMFISPLACALASHRGALAYKHLEPDLKEHLCRRFYERPPKYVYYDRSWY